MKIQPIDSFLNQYKEEGCGLLIGLNFDEQSRINNRHGNKAFIKYEYPLADNKLGRNACIIILKKAGLFPNFPVYMRRGGCIGCFFKQIYEYETMAILCPEEFKVVEDLEIELQTLNKEGFHGRKHIFTILPNISMTQIRENAFKKIKNGFFSPEEIYVNIGNKTPCGVFCNR
jgi:hypothetical protein